MLHENSHKNSKSAVQFANQKDNSIKFTDVSIRHLKPKTRRIDYWYKGLSGFGIRVSKKGTKTWFYYYRIGKTQRRLNLGKYPQLSLSDALVLYNDARSKVEQDIDPFLEQKNAEKQFDEELTVTQLVELYLEHSKKSGKKSYKVEEKCLKKDLLPHLGKRKITTIEPKDLAKIFNEIITKREAPSSATHLYSYIRRIFNFASDMGLMRRRDNPCLDIKLNIKKKKRNRHLTPQEIYLFWYGVDKIKMTSVVRYALKFMLLTLARGGEVRQMKWSDIDFNERIWTLPKTKNGHLHRIYLNDKAINILQEVRKYSDGKGLVFGSTGQFSKCGIIKNNLKPLHNRTLCQPIKRHFNVFKINKPFTPHDLRRTGATIVAGLFGRQDLVKMCLNHVRNDITDVYDQYTYDVEKKNAMNALNKAISLIIDSPNIESVPTFDVLRQKVLPKNTMFNGYESNEQSMNKDFQAIASRPVSYRLSFDLKPLSSAT
ncbi:site-specific integrase [uncultured Winogradskyella sp.]|uniref:tyrosine-type recombinase/integrase n=1 Tax=uncultured Winogradskyella sp. TaxID=395353 RepID=UPI00260FBAFF|nr:site-specific integrase [uncultured Winogradskyella sp.]